MTGGKLDQLISDARRRSIVNLILDQSTWALTIALGGAALLLVAGTQILNWYWPVVLFAGAFGYGLWRIGQALPDSYQVAQKIDQQLDLHDALSTAWHYQNSSNEVAVAQRRQAEQQAATVEANLAVPLLLPKAAKWSGLALAVVAALFVTRYGVQKSLDLKRPLVAFTLDQFGSTPKEQASAAKKPGSPMDEYLKSISVQPAEEGQKDGLDAAPESALGTVEVPDVNNENSQQANGKTNEKGPGMGDGQDKGEGTEESEGASKGNEKGEDNGKQGANNQGKQDGQQQAKNNAAQQPGENSSMMDKMKDALANLMSKMNMQQKGGEQQNQPGNQQQKSGSQSANARQQQKGQQPSKGQKADQQQQASNNQQQGDQDQESEASQASQGKPGDKNSQSASNQENKSGMGKQDGDKDVKLAEQMAAMGKISEIIGKRNQNLQGEIMVEVNSSKQQLKTQYTQRAAKHSDAGGEIHRDEVPLMYHNYVQQYFDEVRKAPAAAPGPAAKGPAKPNVPSEIP
ncbi:MAG: hypothetical protein NTZ56_02120 [Acidobacteria bacterium]|nr:hypothetical protein [Acidobacteriota bacterium]